MINNKPSKIPERLDRSCYRIGRQPPHAREKYHGLPALRIFLPSNICYLVII